MKTLGEMQKENLKYIEEKPVNEAFLFEHNLYKAIEVTDEEKRQCGVSKCDLINTMPCRCAACSSLQRKDKKNVIFVKTDKF